MIQSALLKYFNRNSFQLLGLYKHIWEVGSNEKIQLRNIFAGEFLFSALLHRHAGETFANWGFSQQLQGSEQRDAHTGRGLACTGI